MTLRDNAAGTSHFNNEWWHIPRQIYIKCTSDLIPCPEAMGYTMGKTLGSGTYAKVKAAWSPFEGKMIAIKTLNKKQASEDYLTKFLPREMAILQKVSHANIIRVLQIIETELKCFFVLEIAENGDLLDYINTRRYLPEPEARFVFDQMSQAIAFCHDRDIVHRDLKCENVMLSRGMDVKIGDFGFSLDLKSKPASTPCGSYSYAAPELFTSNGQTYNGKKADIWSMGVILYAMVCGRLPFGDDSQVKKMQAQQNRQVTFSRNLSYECRGFIHNILNMDIEARPSVRQILASEWTKMDPSTRPIQLTPSNPNNKYKYSIENCLPSTLHHIKSRNSCSSNSSLWAQAISAPYPTTNAYAAMIHQQLSKMRNSGEDHPVAKGTTTVPSSSMEADMITDGNLHHQEPVDVRGECSSLSTKSSHHKRPLVSRIGAAGRKIADAMKSVKSQRNQKGHSVNSAISDESQTSQ